MPSTQATIATQPCTNTPGPHDGHQHSPERSVPESQHSSGPQDMEDTCEILQIHPMDTASRYKVHLLMELAHSGILNPHHRQYLRTTGKKLLYEPPIEPPFLINEGYFSVGWYSTLLRGPDAFRIGRGDHEIPRSGIDIILAPPNDKSGRKIAQVHLILKLHPESGAWMMDCIDETTVGLNALVANERVCLSQPQTMITIKGHVYMLKFMIESEKQQMSYLQKRNRLLQNNDVDYPSLFHETRFSGIPLATDLRLDIAVTDHGIGSGTFGTVFKGFDPRSGGLRAVKRLVITNSNIAQAVREECAALDLCTNHYGIVRVFGFRNQKGKAEIPTRYPADYFIVMEYGIPLSQVARHAPHKLGDLDVWEWRAWITLTLLAGLEVVHGKGGMHRDVNWSNILYFAPISCGKPRAVLADFGKYTQRTFASETNIANWNFLPPEIRQDEERVYTQSIDVWMLANALILTFWPEVYRRRLIGRHPDHLQDIIAILDQTEAAGQPLVSILKVMFAPQPNLRVTASQAIRLPEFHKYLNQDDWAYFESCRQRL